MLDFLEVATTLLFLNLQGAMLFSFPLYYMVEKGRGSLIIVIADRAPEELFRTHREACADPDHISMVPLPLLQLPSVMQF